MKVKLGIVILIFGIALSIQLSAQSEPVIDSSKNILLLKERSFGVIFHTQGWGLKYNSGINKTAFTKRMLTFEFAEMKSPKQIRIINPYYTNAKSYIYGKLNAVFLLRGSYGNYKQLNRKPYWGGVELRLLYMGGVSLGFAKPIYLYIIDQSSPDIIRYYEAKFDPVNQGVEEIYGRAPFTSGFNEITVHPGFHFKAGLDFDYASYRTKVKSLEIGAIVDVFPNPIPIMAFDDPEYFFVTLYLSFSFGKRFN